MALAPNNSSLSTSQRALSLVSLRQIREAIDGKAPLPDRSCLITFDDGLRCHYATVYPLMQKHNFPAAFFACTLPLAEGRATQIHKSHYVRAHATQGTIRLYCRSPALNQAPMRSMISTLKNTTVTMTSKQHASKYLFVYRLLRQ